MSCSLFFFGENGVISRITQPYIIREYPVIRKILFGRISEVFVFEPYSICIIRIRTVFDFLVFVTSLGDVTDNSIIRLFANNRVFVF